MYAVVPSAEAITSCGSGPTGNLAVTFRLAGLTIRSVLSSLARINRALSGAVCAFRPRAPSDKTTRMSSKVLIFMTTSRHRHLGIRARILSAEHHLPSGAVVVGFFPGLFDLVRIQPYYFHSVQYAFSIGSVTCAFKFRRAGRDLARGEYMNPALVVSEHSVPALVVRTVSEDVLTIVAPSAVPILDDEALVER